MEGGGGEEKKRANERVVEGFDGQVAGLGDKWERIREEEICGKKKKKMVCGNGEWVLIYYWFDQSEASNSECLTPLLLEKVSAMCVCVCEG